jgi:hypothetical protein
MAVAIVIGLGFYLAGQTAATKGLVLGTLFSVINFVLMGETLPLKLGRTQRKTVVFAFLFMVARYVLLALPLVIAVRSDRFHLVAAIVGVFMIQIVILLDHLGRFLPVIRKKTL